jgi:hypothetical protein
VTLLGCVQRRSLYWVLNLWISSLTDVIVADFTTSTYVCRSLGFHISAFE